MANEGSSNKCKNLAKVKDSETTNTDAVVLSNEKATQSTFVDMKLICENCKQVNKRNSYADFFFHFLSMMLIFQKIISILKDFLQ